MTPVLLHDAYAPVTSRTGFLHAPLDDVAEALRAQVVSLAQVRRRAGL